MVEECLVVVPSGLLIILVVLNLALKQAVARLPVLVNVAVVRYARDVRLIKIKLKHLPDAIITKMLLLTVSEHPKNKI